MHFPGLPVRNILLLLFQISNNNLSESSKLNGGRSSTQIKPPSPKSSTQHKSISLSQYWTGNIKILDSKSFQIRNLQRPNPSQSTKNFYSKPVRLDSDEEDKEANKSMSSSSNYMPSNKDDCYIIYTWGTNLIEGFKLCIAQKLKQALIQNIHPCSIW